MTFTVSEQSQPAEGELYGNGGAEGELYGNGGDEGELYGNGGDMQHGGHHSGTRCDEL